MSLNADWCAPWIVSLLLLKNPKLCCKPVMIVCKQKRNAPWIRWRILLRNFLFFEIHAHTTFLRFFVPGKWIIFFSCEFIRSVGFVFIRCIESPRGLAFFCFSCGGKLNFFTFAGSHAVTPYSFTFLARISCRTFSIPNLSMIRNPLEDTLKVIKRFSAAIQKRRFLRFGKKRRLTLFLAWETLFPDWGRFPVT